MTVLALVVMSVAGCDATSPGTPRADSTTTTTSTPSVAASTSSTGSRLPSRPRDIAVTELDPCTLLTYDQRAALALAAEPIDGGPFTRATGELSCSFGSATDQPPRVGFHIALNVEQDASVLLIPDSNGISTTVADVAGFPAVREAGQDSSLRPCRYAVSTTADQYLEVRLDYSSAASEGRLPVEQACERTLQAATFAMQTLQAQR